MRPTRRQILAATLAAPFSARGQEPGFAILEAGESSLRLLDEPAAPTPVWAFNGAVPGPLLRVKKGEEVRVRFVNKLSQPAALHFHGPRFVNSMDGAVGLTQEAVAPGKTFDYRFTPGDSGFSWYRPSDPRAAAEQMARGLRGLLIVEETNPPAVDFDLPLVISDWRLDAQGAVAGPFPDPAAMAGEGRVGALVTVNSRAAPQTQGARPGARIRLRLLNACNARLLAVIFDGLRPRVLAVDGQPCDPFEPQRLTLPLGPGARFDVMFDLPAQEGARAALKLRGGGLRADPRGEPDRDLLVFQPKGEPISSRGEITGLEANPLLPPEIHLEKAKRFDVIVEGPGKNPARPWSVNGGKGDVGGKPLFTVARNQPVALGFINKTPVAQCLRLHGHVMRVLHLLDDGWEPYWRDAVIVPPGKTARVAFLADNPGKWLIESAIVEHAAGGVRAWYEAG